MQIKITARHGQLDDETQAAIRVKADKLIHYFDRITEIEVTVDLQNTDRRDVEIRVDAEHKHDFVARGEDTLVMTAFDQALAKMEQQIHRYKEKIQDHRRDVPMNNGGM